MLRLLLLGLLGHLLFTPSQCVSFSILTLQNEDDFFDATAERDWDAWGEWQPCSRSCGGGVTFMLRHCLKTRENGVSECVGPERKYSSCNIQDCPEGSIDFRAEQCAAYNNQSYGGRTHQWTPYVGASVLNPCELHCQPEDSSFIIKHADKVIDGTRCHTNSLNVCVDGICQNVGCDMILGSDLKHDKCMECAGNGSSCYRIHGVFDAPNPTKGYTDVIVIPSGATNIEIDEHRASRNYLALRNGAGEYVLNGNWKINRSHSIQVAGTTVYYHRKLDRRRAPESLRASGPTMETLYVDLVVQEKNRGIRYNFYLPRGESDPNRGNIEWIAEQWSRCSRDCGGGTQSRRLSCHRDGRKVSYYQCKSIQRPQRRQQCNLDPCFARWHSDNWTECTESCNGGIRFRQVYCTETPKLSKSPPRLVHHSRCMEEDSPVRPPSQERCNENPCNGWIVGNWSECSSTCGIGQQRRQVSCHLEASCPSNTAPETARECNHGPCTGIEWVVTDWSPCTEQCGQGMQTRVVHCASVEGVKYDDELCKNLPQPASHRRCHSTSECNDILLWMTGKWSECSAGCGKGMQTRKVVCSALESSGFRTLPDEHCEGVGEKPDFMRNCTMPKCGAGWFTGSWQPCSSSCGGGRHIRHVMCLTETTYNIRDESVCDVDQKPLDEEVCNAHACPGQQPDESDITGTEGETSEFVRCSLSTYGCCPDNRTNAQGWFMEGCINVNPTTDTTSVCQSSRFGCCRDGVQRATGTNHYGCPEYEPCYVASDEGTLCSQAWLSRWYFDSEAEECRHFWYGGCGGNRNNHISMERCLQMCYRRVTVATNTEDTKDPDVTSHLLSSETTTTTSSPGTTSTLRSSTITTTVIPPNMSSPRVVQTALPRPTLTFVPNSAPTRTTYRNELVQSTRTVVLPVVKNTHSVWLGRRTKVLSVRECSLPPLKGPCLRRNLRWYFDGTSQTCRTFIFGGCTANANNFVSRDECQSSCGSSEGFAAITTSPRATNCELERTLSEFHGRVPPQCEPSTGRYRELQCISDDVTSACWCVHPESGREIDGTRRYDSVAPDCELFRKTLTTPPSSCSISLYGCCPDGVTPARGYGRSGCEKAPRIRLDRTTVMVKRGGSARLSCPASGNPKPTVRWFKNEQQLPIPTSKSSIKIDNDLHSLILLSVLPQDLGIYACEASNGVGQPQRKTIRLALQQNRLRFRTRPTNVTVDEGEVIVLKCRVRGSPASIAWFKDGKRLHRGNTLLFKRWGDLHITSSNPADSGKYVCVVSGSREDISASSYIKVHPKRRTTAPTQVSHLSTSTQASTINVCTDSPALANCPLIVTANMCHKKPYDQFCCLSCRHSRYAESIRGRRRVNRVLPKLLRLDH